MMVMFAWMQDLRAAQEQQQEHSLSLDCTAAAFEIKVIYIIKS